MLLNHDVETGELLVLVVGVDGGLRDQSVQLSVAQFRHGLKPTEVVQSGTRVPGGSSQVARAASLGAGPPVAPTATPNVPPSASVTSPATLAAPTALATSRRAALRSTTVTDRAPARFSSWRSSRPIVPAPISRTSSPRTDPMRRRP